MALLGWGSVSGQSLEGVGEEIRAISGRYDATVGVAVILNGKDTLTVNDGVRYPMMSVFKFHQALAVCDYLRKNGMSYRSRMYVGGEDLRKDTYSPLRDRYPEGNLYLEIGELLEYTLQWSDNNACDLLFDRCVGVEETDAFIRSFGTGDFSIAVNEREMHDDLENCYRNWTSPLAAARLLDAFAGGEVLTGELRDFIERLMVECTTGAARLAYPLKDGNVVLGHKTGTGDRNVAGRLVGVNDIGFVRLPDGGRYVIAVFVKDSAESYEVTERIIAEVSAVVYRQVVAGIRPDR